MLDYIKILKINMNIIKTANNYATTDEYINNQTSDKYKLKHKILNIISHLLFILFAITFIITIGKITNKSIHTLSQLSIYIILTICPINIDRILQTFIRIDDAKTYQHILTNIKTQYSTDVSQIYDLPTDIMLDIANIKSMTNLHYNITVLTKYYKTHYVNDDYKIWINTILNRFYNPFNKSNFIINENDADILKKLEN